MVQRLLEKKGLTFTVGKQTRSIEQNNGLLKVVLNNGESSIAGFVLFSAGVRPDLQCIRQTSITKNRGIVVDEFMQTNVPNIYACGDVAEFDGILSGLWQSSREQAITCGNHIIGKDLPYKASVPSTRLKVAGIDFASVGEIEITDGVEAALEKNEELGLYKKLFTRDKKLVGAILIGNVKEAGKLQQIIKAGGTP